MTDSNDQDTPEGIYLDRVVLTIEVERSHTGSVINYVRDKHQAQVMENYPSPRDLWSEDSQFTRDDWQADVTQGDTNLGYWAWVAHAKNVLEDSAASDTSGQDGGANSILQLATEVYGLLKEHTESFEADDIGSDGLYLVGAIMKDEKCEWPSERPIVTLLKAHLPADHPIFKHIDIVRTLTCGHTTTDAADECQHQQHEDHLICECCHRCHESLSDADLCTDCGGKIED